MRSSLAILLIASAAFCISCGNGGQAASPAVQLFATPVASGAAPLTGTPSSPPASPTAPVLPTPGAVGGRVLSVTDGRVLTGAQLSLGSLTTAADTAGDYSFSNLPPGTYTLTASLAGFIPRSYNISVTSGAVTTKQVELSVAGVLTGIIASAMDATIGGAPVRYSGGALNTVATVTTDDHGHFSAGWVPVGTYVVTVSASGYRTRAVTANVTTGQTTTANVTLTPATGSSAAGPLVGSVVMTLPNPQVTPNWRNYAPQDCQPDPSVCADDDRFWGEFDFTNFATAIDAALAAIAEQGNYTTVLTIMALADSPTYWHNIQLVYDSAAGHGLIFQPVLFPKRKWGKEWCYLYPNNAPSADCVLVPGTTTAVAYEKMMDLMKFVQELGGGCGMGRYNRPFAIWYGWAEFSPGYDTLFNFWKSLPNSSCHHQSAYVTWLDEPNLMNSDIAQLQAHVVNDLQLPFWINTELYITANIIQHNDLYAPYQTVVVGYPLASDITSWAQGMCGRWTSAAKPERLGVWTFYDRDIAPVEQYRGYIRDSMARVQAICAE